jgi:hypothetical protein
VPFLRFDREIRTVICTTNAIESINARLPPGSGSGGGDGNVGGPKVEIASERRLAPLQDVRLWRLAPRLRDAEHWS